ncbi:beta-1,4-N-acetylgalactosaminyltransferase bre-4-like [Ornithodoros turicata]|uniref:beta-1,4-N-acetylgalactosaminyltransferase bre-4-like n=1 Tax=Ornithodoros turicata TaxID=34597 RepID=UPI003138E88B
MHSTMLSAEPGGSSSGCRPSLPSFCRSRFYRLLVAVVVIFLLVEYSVNLLAYSSASLKNVSPGLTWFLGADPLQSEAHVSRTSFSIGDSIGVVNQSRHLVNGSGNQTVFRTDNVTEVVAPTNTSVLELCPLIPPKLVGPLKVLKDSLSFEELEKLFPDLMPGGRYKPKECVARHRVAIIIPYRDREEHLRVFLHNMHYMLRRQQLDYGIFVVEEVGKEKFNRAKLMNIGYLEASALYDYQCFIFHDVDLIPEDDRNLYTCPEHPRHMSVAIDVFKYRLPYAGIFGGVSALKKEHMQLVNGFSNEFWGWGGEDDDMSYRLKHYKLPITRYPANIARYTMLKHEKDTPNPERYKFLHKGRLRYKTDGINSVKYKRVDIVFKKLYTWILADVKPKD